MDSLKKVNKFGRTYTTGKPLGEDLKHLIIDRILQEGGDRLSGFLPKTYSFFAEEMLVSRKTIKNVWERFCLDYSLTPKPRGGTRWRKLEEEDLELIEVLKIHTPSISLAEIIETVSQFGGPNISTSTVSKALKSARLPSGQQYSRKKLTKVAIERFTPENIFYTQLFINYLSSKDPRKIKFFDEAGVKQPDVGTRTYGHSPTGSRCVEVVRKHESPNQTLNLLVSLNGSEYHNLIHGATNTLHFLRFFQEAAESVNPSTGRPSLEVGDIIVMDNLSAHHYEGGLILEEWLQEMGIELLYTPSYSPDLNPVELCFNKVKGLLNGELRDLVNLNIRLATMEAVEKVSPQDMVGFYEATSYLFV